MDVSSILISAGPYALVLLAVMVFVENGLLFPFLPGDSLVFGAALLAGSLHFHWLSIAMVAALAAIVGGEVGFSIGRKRGRQLFSADARVFKQRYLDEADAFFGRYGSSAILLARFVPVVRTFCAPVAGLTGMRRRTFSLWNLTGGLAWAIGLAFAGSLLGGIPWVSRNVEVLSLGIVVVSLAPMGVSSLAHRRRAQRADDL